MRKKEQRVLYCGKWIALHQTTWTTENGTEVTWESVVRTNTHEVVVTVPLLQPSHRVVLIRQFRPAIDNYVLGFPAGLIEECSVEEAALKELTEETGYHGTVVSVSPPLTINSALLRDRSYLVRIDIDENLPVNQTPLQNLEPSEEIEVLVVPFKNIRETLLRYQRKGDEIGSGLWYLFGVWDHLPPCQQ
jgi:ADP-ribose pyrophosphatase